MRLTPARSMLLVAAVAFLAYLPVLDGEFLGLDDHRFVRDNPEVHRLDLRQAFRFFTDPTTLSPVFWQGTYRPLRTLEFSIDWKVSGGRPWFFHLRNVLYHVLGALLVLALFRRLSPSGGAAPPVLFGALLFAVHPVQTESVAWITSRGDTMLLVTLLGALLLHVKGRRVLAALVLVLSLFSKESAVVFPAIALLADHCRGATLRWRWYGLYAVLVGLFLLLWLHVQDQGLGHHRQWWGAGYGSNLLTMARGLLHYAGLVVLPVRQVTDYAVPATTGFDLAAALGILVALLAAFAAWRGGRCTRFAVLWFAVTILPMSNLLFTVGAPTAERFLYVPLVGLCFLGGHFLARAGSRIAWVPVLCLFALTLERGRDWRDYDRLMKATRRVSITQLGQVHLAQRELEEAHDARDEGDRERTLRHAEAVVRVADELVEYLRERLGYSPQGRIFEQRANALYLMGRYGESLASAEEALRHGGEAPAHRIAADARLALAELELEAAREALAQGEPESATRRATALIPVFDELVRDAREWVGGRALVAKADALRFLGRSAEALTTALEAIDLGGGAYAHYNAAAALAELEREAEAARHVELAIEQEYEGSVDLRQLGAQLWNAAARKLEAAGKSEAALQHYQRSWRLLADAEENVDARSGIDRLGR